MGSFTFVLPDQIDVRDTISDYLAALPGIALSTARIEQVTNNCVKPIALLIEAGELACAAGPDEIDVFAHFIRSLYAQVQVFGNR